MENKISWHIYSAESEAKNEFSSTEEAIQFLKSQPNAEDFFCWREGFEDWQGVATVLEFRPAFLKDEKSVTIEENAAPLPPPLPKKSRPILVPLEQATPPTLNDLVLTPTQDVPIAVGPIQTAPSPKPSIPPEAPLSPQNSVPPRKHERFELRFRVILRSRQITFRTFSKNISLGGIATEHPIPRDLINEDCTIYIANPSGEENIKFNIRFATERQDTKYFYFTEISPTAIAKLQKWIESFQQKIKKTA